MSSSGVGVGPLPRTCTKCNRVPSTSAVNCGWAVRAPAWAIDPALGEALHEVALGPLAPAAALRLVGPAGARQAVAKVVEDGLLDVDAKRCGFHALDSSRRPPAPA